MSFIKLHFGIHTMFYRLYFLDTSKLFTRQFNQISHLWKQSNVFRTRLWYVWLCTIWVINDNVNVPSFLATFLSVFTDCGSRWPINTSTFSLQWERQLVFIAGQKQHLLPGRLRRPLVLMEMDKCCLCCQCCVICSLSFNINVCVVIVWK